MSNPVDLLHQKIAAFRRRYYMSLVIRGVLLTLTWCAAYFMMISLLEYVLWLSAELRQLIFICFFVLVLVSLYVFFRNPFRWWVQQIGLTDEETARLIRTHFSSIDDRLLNLLQLEKSSYQSDLVKAGVLQKATFLNAFSFERAIRYRDSSKKYIRYFLFVLGLIALIFLINRRIFYDSTYRILRFQQDFSPPLPFEFLVPAADLEAFFNEDHTVHLRFTGEYTPSSPDLIIDERRIPLVSKEGVFTYTFEKIQHPITFHYEAAGYVSKEYQIDLIYRPNLHHMSVSLRFPAYLNMPSEKLDNLGPLTIPEGTLVQWHIQTNYTKRSFLFLRDGNKIDFSTSDHQTYVAEKSFFDPNQYSIVLENDNTRNKERITYPIEIVKDAYPKILVNSEVDSVLQKSILIKGNISDDYGLKSLELLYFISSNGKSLPEERISIPLPSTQTQQNFVHLWNLSSIKIAPQDQIIYYLQVWDNDGVNGSKVTRSPSFIFALPTKEHLYHSFKQSENQIGTTLQKAITKIKTLSEAIEDLERQIRSKQHLEWQDKRELQDILRKKQQLHELLNALKKENQQLMQKIPSEIKNNPKIAEKAEQIRKMMDEMMDEENQALFKKLSDMLQEEMDINELKDFLNNLNQKEQSLEKEMERTLELFNQLRYDFLMEKTLLSLKELITDQDSLLKDTKDSRQKKSAPQKSKRPSDSLARDQKERQKDLEKIEESMQQLNQLGRELNKSDESVPQPETLSPAKKSMEKSYEHLKNKAPQKAINPQQEALDKMKEVEQVLKTKQQSMQASMDRKNLEALRHILHGFIKLSFHQEDILDKFQSIQSENPLYKKYAQEQVEIQEDVQVVGDSLIALSKKDVFLNSAVTKKLYELNNHLDKSLLHIKERKKPNAEADMQYSMSSINSLALMLSDHYESMLNRSRNNRLMLPNPEEPNLSEQQNRLNQKIEELKKGQTTGRKLSEELARLAAEQERIRRALEKLQKKLLKDQGKAPGSGLSEQMKQTELDLVNKEITEKTIRRQREIMVRLLDAENALREQGDDTERESEIGKEYEHISPKMLEKYLKEKQREVEFIQTLPLKLRPYYKREATRYFNQIRKINKSSYPQNHPSPR